MMKKILIVLTVCAMFSCNNVEHKNVYPSVKGLIHRVVPQIEDEIILDSIAAENGKDVFEIYSEGRNVVLAGSSPVAIASALNWYLKYYCHCHFARAGQNMNLPEELPKVKEKVHIASPYKYRYWLNYCTFNYTMSFWTWDQWQRELDWMAMNGINLSLSIVGMEKVWQNTLKQFNFSDKETSEFICGPAYQAWWLMENLEGWGGPVSQEYIEKQSALEKQIVSRMHEFGMKPLFQGFFGMVPFKLKEKFPKNNIMDAGLWCDYQRPTFLMPDDSLFPKMAKVFYAEQEKLYGKAEFFGGDPFHEGGRADAADLTKCGRLIQQSMQASHPEATWVLQGWLGNPSPKLLAETDKDHILVLDLVAETLADWNGYQSAWKISKGFSGSRWIWCTVTNYGGRNGLYGKLDSTTNVLDEARKSEYGKRLEGIGVMPEGSHINPFMFDYFFELGWRNQLPVPEKWAQDYSVFRYGKDLPDARKAWQLLSRSIYNIPMCFDEPQSILCARPSLKVVNAAPWGNYPIRYDQKQLIEAVNYLLNCSNELATIDAYMYDVTDMTRQIIMGELEFTYKAIIDAIDKKDKIKFKTETDKFIALAEIEEKLVSTRGEFLLGRWIESARNLGSTEAEKDQFEQNARMLLTTWGYGKQHKTLRDYAHREWAGLISSYYLPRWKIFFSDQDLLLKEKSPHAFDYDAFEEAWTKQHTKFPVEPSGNSIEISREIINTLLNK
jgi:alpha-N-acetylglucosaminidase